MNLVIDKVEKLEVIHDADRYGVIKASARASVGEDGLAVLTQTRLTEGFTDIGLMCAVKDGGFNLISEMLRGKAEVNLEHLTDIHSGRNAQRIKHYIKRSAVGQEGHILL